MDYSVSLVDNSDILLRALPEQIEAALTAVGQQATSHAKVNITRAGKVDTGALRNSMTFEVRPAEDAVYVGSNLYYAPYVEYGTGKFGDNPTGSGWWVYVVGNGKSSRHSGKRYTYDEALKIMTMLRAKGLDAHISQGMKPTHFLKDAVTEHPNEYKQIVKKYLEG